MKQFHIRSLNYFLTRLCTSNYYVADSLTCSMALRPRLGEEDPGLDMPPTMLASAVRTAALTMTTDVSMAAPLPGRGF